MFNINRIVLLCGIKNADIIEVLEDMKVNTIVVNAKDEKEIKGGDIVITDRNIFFFPKEKAFAFIIDEALDDFDKTGENIITCGMSSKATVSISSKTEGTIVLSIGCPITDIGGGIIEPQDIVVSKRQKYDDFIFAAAVAAMLCIGGSNYH